MNAVTILLLIITVYLIIISRKLDKIDFDTNKKIEGFEERIKKVFFEAADYISDRADNSLPSYTIKNKSASPKKK